MKRFSTAKMLLAGLALAPLASISTTTATAQSVVRPAQDIVLSIGRGELINVPGTMADVFVADDNVADVQVKSTRQLYVFGRAGGETTIYASNAAGDIVWSANVRVGSNISSIDQMLGLAMPNAKINVATMGTNTVLLTGTVAAPEDAAEAQALVEAFVGDETNVISRLRMATPLQVNLRVRFAEVSRTLVRNINGSLQTRDQSNGFRFGAQVGDAGSIVGNNPSSAIVPLDPCAVFEIACRSELRPYDIINRRFVTNETRFETPEKVQQALLSGAGRLLGLDLLGALDVGEELGLVSTISEPNLTALSGETAEFLAGGEFPIPQAQGLGTTAVEYRNFGVSLTYTPTVLANGRISMRVRPEVSELTSQGAVILNGFQIPALRTRRAETTIELGSGQSFMIAGLMQNSSNDFLEKTPGLGDVPILGNLFRSKSYQKGETELVIVVTPYLVKPVNDSDIVLPTDGFRSATALEQFIANRQSGLQADVARPGPTAREAVDGNAPSISRGPVSGGAQAAGAPEQNGRVERVAGDVKPGFSFK